MLKKLAVNLALNGTTGLPGRIGDTPDAEPINLPAAPLAPPPVLLEQLPPQPPATPPPATDANGNPIRLSFRRTTASTCDTPDPTFLVVDRLSHI